MTQPSPIPSNARIVDAMIELARAARSNRIIVAGTNSAEIFLELHRRGYPHVTTTKISLVPCGQHEVALVAWRERPTKALVTTLDRLVHYLTASGVLVFWIGPHERVANQLLGSALQRLGFRIESGTHCENGIAIAARRVDSFPAAKAA
jgi:hypothetical protein